MDKGIGGSVTGQAYEPVAGDVGHLKKCVSDLPVRITLPATFGGDRIPHEAQITWAWRGLGRPSFVGGDGVAPFLNPYANAIATRLGVVTTIWDAEERTWWITGNTPDF